MRADELATIFHEKAGAFLAELGFELQNDPAKTVGRPGFAMTSARYRSPQGLYLGASFDPIDGASAGLSCGRRWQYASELPSVPDHDRLSNYYWVLAETFGFDLPRYYELSPGDESIRAIETMLDDLKATLPTVLERVTLEDLMEAENKQYGCGWSEEKHGRQRRCSRLEAISPYPE